MRVVFDCNVLISATLKKNSKPDLAFRKVTTEGEILCSLHTLKELSGKLLESKFDKYVSVETRLEFLLTFKEISAMIEVIHTVDICRDQRITCTLNLHYRDRPIALYPGTKTF